MEILTYLFNFSRLVKLIKLALNPEQWKTDPKSILIIVVGIPIGALAIYVAYI